MITVSDLRLSFGSRTLFEDVNLKFLPGYCYGVIGANGAGKSTFLKLLSGELEPSSGTIGIPKGLRMSVLEQDQFKYDEELVLDTVFMGYSKLYDIMKERDALYAKPDFSEDDGMRAAELEGEYAEMDGYSVEAEAATLLDGLGIDDSYHFRTMGELEAGEKVRVLLAQAMFGEPGILLLDEPTNNLNAQTIEWLEEYLGTLENTVTIVVSHDRQFLNNVCTHIVDIDFRKLNIYVGNYDFWYQASDLVVKQIRGRNKKREDKVKALKAFIQRFSAGSRSRQATARQKLLDNLTIEQLPISSRKYPHIQFDPERPCGRSILMVENLTHSVDGERVLDNFNLVVQQGDKIAFTGPDVAITTLFKILAGELEPDGGSFEWGGTVTLGYFPKDNEVYFDTDANLVDWLRQYSDDQSEEYVRGFLGRMLFSGEESQKPARVLSGGEKVRCMLSKIMLSGSNVLLFDEPTNHLDLEAITSLNQGLMKFEDVLLFSTHDRQLRDTVSNRVIEIMPDGRTEERLIFRDETPDVDINRHTAPVAR